MSYISNGCNDCSGVDFASNGMGLMGGSQNFGANGNMFDGNAGNQFVYQQQQAQPQQAQQIQPTMQPQQVQMQPTIQPQQVQMQPQQVQMQQPLAKIQAQGKQVQLPAQQIQVSSQQVKGNNQSLTGIISHYFNDNAFTIMVAVLVASAWHTTIKFYINQSIKFNGGNPTYYIVYAVLATLIAIFLSSIKN